MVIPTNRDDLAELFAKAYLIRDDSVLAKVVSPARKEEILSGPGDLRTFNEGKVPEVKWRSKGPAGRRADGYWVERLVEAATLKTER